MRFFRVINLTRLWAALAFLLGLLCALPARADLWGYVDERGVPHFSATPLDARYELFLRGPSELPGAAAAIASTGPAPAPLAESGPAAPSVGQIQPTAQPRLMSYLESLPAYHATQPLLREAAQATGLDPLLLQAVVAAESGFDARAISPKGAIGLMQLIVPTAQRYGVQADRFSPVQAKLMDPKTNIAAGSRYLRDLLAMFKGQLELSLAAYNAGEGAVQRAGNQIPNYPETQNYVRTVMQLYRHWQAQSGVLAVPVGTAAAMHSAAAVPAAAPPIATFVGGAAGRGNMPPPVDARPLLGPLPGMAGLPR